MFSVLFYLFIIWVYLYDSFQRCGYISLLFSYMARESRALDGDGCAVTDWDSVKRGGAARGGGGGAPGAGGGGGGGGGGSCSSARRLQSA